MKDMKIMKGAGRGARYNLCFMLSALSPRTLNPEPWYSPYMSPW